MSRTKRNIPGYFSKNSTNLEKYGISKIIDRVRHGLISMPKGSVSKSGNIGIDEISGQTAKKFAKRLRNRYLRRKNKKIED